MRVEELKYNLKNLTTQKQPKNAVLKGFDLNFFCCPSPRRLRYVFYERTHKNKCFKIKNGWNWMEMRVVCYEKPPFSPSLKNENCPYKVPGNSKTAEMVSNRFKMIENIRKSFKIIFFDHTRISKLLISPLKIKFHQKFSKCSSSPSRDRILSN